MEIITSQSNEKVKALKRLKDKRERDKERLFLLEGVNLIKDLTKDVLVTSVYLSQSKATELINIAKSKCDNITVLADNIFNSVADTVTPQGILATAKIPEERKLSGSALVLDGISDMGNLGTILRTAAAFNIKDVVLYNSADPYDGKAVRSSMGGFAHLNIIRTRSLDCLMDYTLLALDMGGSDIADYKVTSSKTALAVGSEAHGLSPEVTLRADKTLSIPMYNMESLNAGIAAGIALYKLFIGC